MGVLERISRWCHDNLDWGYPVDNCVEGFDGASFTSTCKFCGKHLLMDSNGDWFHSWR